MSDYSKYQQDVRNTILGQLREDIGWDGKASEANKKSSGAYKELVKRDPKIAREAAFYTIYDSLKSEYLWGRMERIFDEKVANYVDLPYKKAARKAAKEIYAQSKNLEEAAFYSVLGEKPPSNKGKGPSETEPEVVHAPAPVPPAAPELP